MTKRRRYTDEFRAKAVATAIAEGYPQKKGALSQAARQLGIKHQLLRNWVIGSQNPPPQEMLHEKRVELRDLLQAEMESIMESMQMKRATASYNALGLVFGILFDKARLMDDLPTQIVAVIPELVDTIKRKGYDPVAALQTMKTQFAALPDVPMVTPNHGEN